MKPLRGAVQRGFPAPRRACVTVLLAAFSASPAARAQTAAATPTPDATASPAEIVAARELFRQGTEDADAGRYADGLEKFRRVAAVKETGAVRFNIARCEEALGRGGAALADFELAAREAGADPKSADVSTLAAQRADALRPKVPRLTVTGPSPAPDGMVVSLDGGRLASATLGVALPVDPGSHVVDAKAPGMAPFHAEVTAIDGQNRKVALDFTPLDPAALAAERSANASADLASSTQRTWGFVTLAAGGALALGAGLFLILHNNAVANLNTDCPEQRCPVSQSPQIDGTESDARTYEGVSIGFLAASVVAVGTGVVLLATVPKATPAPSVSVTTGAPMAPAGVTLRGTF